ncbi:MAG: hypothetical protein A2Y15_06640 [Clostridiales bacterium GWF2_36_10]|nr:MAG: hypothetical protein A2Y15_06640 [Clostridiales bacterium GWF2_36_10]
MQNNKSSSSKKKVYMITKLINIVVIIILLFVMFIYALFFSRVKESDYDKDLTKFPEFTFKTFFSGEFYSEVTKYYADTIHNRDRFKDKATQIEVLYGIPEEEEEFGDTTPPTQVVDNDNSNVNAEIEESDNDVSQGNDNSTPDISDPSGENSEPVFDEELCEGIVILNNRAMELYYGNTNNARTYAGYVNAYAEQLGSGVNIYSMVIPKPCAYYIQESKKYGDIWQNTINDLNAINESLVGVRNVDVYNALLPHKDEEIYFRTDIHWTGLGAYYATKAFSEIASVPFADLSTYEKKVREKYVGTMYRYTKSAKLIENPEDFVTYVPSAIYSATFYKQNYTDGFNHDLLFYIKDENKSDWYSTYIAGDSYVVKIESEKCNNGRKLIIFKDSYGNPIAPFLLESFEEIYVVDIRKFELNSINFINENGITDVLFAVSAFTASGSVQKHIERIRTQ